MPAAPPSLLAIQIPGQSMSRSIAKLAPIPGYTAYAKCAAGVLESRSPLDYLAGEAITYWAVREHLRGLPSGQVTQIVEVGCGLGYLTFALNRAGYQTTGLDISQCAVHEATIKYGNYYVCADLAQYARLHAGEHDAVVLTEVIEHLADPDRFLRDCIQLLRSNGQLIITTPNRDAWAANVPWETEAPPVHLWWFSKKSLKILAARMGCSLSFIDMKCAPGSHLWRRWYADEIELLSCCPLLDEIGRVAVKPPPPPHTHRKLSARVRDRLRRLYWLPAARLGLAPSPRICAVMYREN